MYNVWGRVMVCTEVWWGNVMERDHLEGPGIDGRTILRWIQEVGWGHGLDLSGSGQGQMVGTCEYSNFPSGSIKCGEYLD